LNPTTFAVRDQNQDQAILLIHGFSGESHSTFGMMPAFLAGNPALYEWDIHCFGYPTALRPDITGVWAADPDLTTLAGFLCTALQQLTTFVRYQKLALIGHSMGGLVIQRALLDSIFLKRISHVILFGTPSDGLKKASLVKLFYRQARDMDRDGAFIKLLRLDWHSRMGDKPPFTFRAVAGIRDEFVPRESSVDVFLPQYRSFINGNHLEIVKPELPTSDSLELLLNLFTKPAGQEPQLHTESFKRVNDLWDSRENLNEKQTEELVYALEATGREADAVELLDGIPDRSTNLTGVLAGRLKRRWLTDPELHASDGPRAQELYHQAYVKANSIADHEQAFYNGINDAFMTLALGKDSDRVQATAAQVLSHTFLAKKARWSRVTQGEAYLYLREPGTALLAYTEAMKQSWTPRELDSIKRQAIWAARLMNDSNTESELQALFDSQQ
jgi:pimeloyl-ACP methyl ester carboxylesterase